MTLVWLGLTLALLVWAAVFLVWDSRVQFARQQRALKLAAERHGREVDDRVWASSRHVEFQRAMAITATRANLVTADDLVEALSTPRQQVVA